MANRILKYIEDITRQRDVNLLDSSITNALFQLVEPKFDSIVGNIGRITLFAGYARITPNDTPVTIIGHADGAHYCAKTHGRNRVCSYDQLLAGRKLAQIE